MFFWALVSVVLAQKFPIVINTWGGSFTGATEAAWSAISTPGTSSLDAVVSGCTYCEQNQCDGTVGYGGSPDESGETTLDAMIMDGSTYRIGAVCDLRRVKNAIGVARAVMEYSTHTMLAGDSATDFATEMGFVEEDLTTPSSQQQHDNWVAGNCQPNYRVNVSPDPTKNCGPYSPITTTNITQISNKEMLEHTPHASLTSHDTISIVVIDSKGVIAAGTSTNGAAYKVPGRVGDGPIPGSGSYADNTVGGCGATGDGDILMRFLPCVLVMEAMRQGQDPTTAAQSAIKRILLYYPSFSAGLVAVNSSGAYGAAAYGWTFTYSVRVPGMPSAQVITVPPLS